jgi:hypothetical protein
LLRYLKRFYDGGRLLPSSLLAAKMYITDVSVKDIVRIVSQPDIDNVFANNSFIQIPETGLAEQF